MLRPFVLQGKRKAKQGKARQKGTPARKRIATAETQSPKNLLKKILAKAFIAQRLSSNYECKLLSHLPAMPKRN